MRRKLKMAIIGGGLMGKEIVSGAKRWCHLKRDIPQPEIVGVATQTVQSLKWFQDNVEQLQWATTDYRELLEKEEIDGVYCAVPHHLHQQIYTDIIASGKHLLGEKPFGIDLHAAQEIAKAAREHPQVLVRCASQMAFYPGAQRIYQMFVDDAFGEILEIRAGFLHSSDMDLEKKINWKRQAAYNGRSGCLGDLGMHTQLLPIRAGITFQSVFGDFRNFVPRRKNSEGVYVDCDTFDNATLLVQGQRNGQAFPMVFETKRLSPGSTNNWYIEVLGMKASGKFTTEDANAFYYLQTQEEQAWRRVSVGYQSAIPAITGPIFEFGFSDAVLQMLGAFVSEVCGVKVDFPCFTLDEAMASWQLMDGALRSYEKGRKVLL